MMIRQETGFAVQDKPLHDHIREQDKEIQRLRELLRQSEAEWEAECIKLRAALEVYAAQH